MSLFVVIVISYVVYKFLQTKTVVVLHESPVIDGRQFNVIFTKTTRRHISKKRRQRIQIIITTPVNLPNFFLDSLYEDKFLYASEFSYYNQNQRLQLEGDFNTYFQLYAPKKFETEVLQVLSPDIMQILIQYIPRTDMYVIGRTIRLSTHVDIDPATSIRDITPLMQKIARFSKVWSVDDEIAFTKNFLTDQPNSEAIKFGSRLFSSQTVAYWVMFFAPAIMWTPLLFVIANDNSAQVNVTPKFIIVSYVFSFAISGIGVGLLYLNDKGIIDLEKIVK